MPDHTDKIEQCCKTYLDPMKSLLGLSRWEIKVVAEQIDPESREPEQFERSQFGDVSVLDEYRYAFIRIDPRYADDMDNLKRTLRHELIHCVFSEFSKAGPMLHVSTKKEQADMVSWIMDGALEKTINNVEHILDDMGFWDRVDAMVG